MESNPASIAGVTRKDDVHRGVGSQGASLNMTREQMESMLRFDEGLRHVKKIGFLTPEARILLLLVLKGAPPVSDAMAVAGTSYRGFYSVLDRLKKAELVQATVDKDDQRVRRLSIQEEIQNDLCA